MDLLERYLQAVKFFLPRRQQDDIVRELSENLVSQMEDREEQLGRALTEDEQAEILRRHGHPMMVAGRYRSHQQLIGPVFFPLYLFALKAGLGIALLVSIIVATIATVLSGDPVREGVNALLAVPGRWLMVFAWTTLGFAALDMARGRLKLTHKWDPRTLPKVVKQADWISRQRSLCELLLSAAGAIWLLLVPWAPVLLFGPAAGILEPAPIWRVAYAPMLLLALATVALQFLQLHASILDSSAIALPRGHPCRNSPRLCVPAARARVDHRQARGYVPRRDTARSDSGHREYRLSDWLGHRLGCESDRDCPGIAPRALAKQDRTSAAGVGRRASVPRQRRMRSAYADLYRQAT